MADWEKKKWSKWKDITRDVVWTVCEFDTRGYWLMGDGATYRGDLAFPYYIPNVLIPNRYSVNYYHFDGIDDSMYVTGVNGLNGKSACTISFWTNYDGSDSHSYFLSKHISGNQFIINQCGGDPKVQYRIWTAGGTISTCGGTGFLDGDWHHIAITYNGTVATIYEDTVPVALSTAGSGAIISNTSDMLIGRDSTSTYFLNGDIDDIAIFDEVVPMSDLWDAGKPKKIDRNASGLVGYWKFDEDTWSNNGGGYWVLRDSSPNAAVGYSAFGNMQIDSRKFFDGVFTNGSLDSLKMDTP